MAHVDLYGWVEIAGAESFHELLSTLGGLMVLGRLCTLEFYGTFRAENGEDLTATEQQPCPVVLGPETARVTFAGRSYPVPPTAYAALTFVATFDRLKPNPGDLS